MIIVPAFSEGPEPDPPHVAAALVSVVMRPATPEVADAVDAPRRVPHENCTHDRAPDHSAPATHKKANQCRKEPGHATVNTPI